MFTVDGCHASNTPLLCWYTMRTFQRQPALQPGGRLHRGTAVPREAVLLLLTFVFRGQPPLSPSGPSSERTFSSYTAVRLSNIKVSVNSKSTSKYFVLNTSSFTAASSATYMEMHVCSHMAIISYRMYHDELMSGHVVWYDITEYMTRSILFFIQYDTGMIQPHYLSNLIFRVECQGS